MKITEAGFSSTETADRNVPLNWTAQNTSVTELSKDRQHHRDRQHTAYQTWALRFLERAQEPIFASHKPESGPPAHFIFLNVPHMVGRSHVSKNRRMSAMYNFSEVRCTVFKTHSSNNMHFGSKHWVFKMTCASSSVHVFLTPERVPTQRDHFQKHKVSKLGPRTHQRGPFRVLEGAQTASASPTPCIHHVFCGSRFGERESRYPKIIQRNWGTQRELTSRTLPPSEW